jgi:hypothetical protein
MKLPRDGTVGFIDWLDVGGCVLDDRLRSVSQRREQLARSWGNNRVRLLQKTRLCDVKMRKGRASLGCSR